MHNGYHHNTRNTRGDIRHMRRRVIDFFKRYYSTLNMDPRVIRPRRPLAEEGEQQAEPTRWKVNLLLLVITLVTTTLAGSSGGNTLKEIVLTGLPFSLTIMAILLSHEMGHYLAARRFNINATLPYFIPFPSLIGTMGAVIKIKSPIRRRRALLYIGAMGPIVGFILSLAAAIAGLYMSQVRPLPEMQPGAFVPIFGDSLLFAFLVKMIHGTIPQGHDVFLSSYAWAGWIGFLVTSLNLMPMGQLDGSHILYALIGRKQLYFGWTAFAALIVLSFVWPGWIVWVILVLLFLMIGHPPVEDPTPLGVGEKIIGWSCVVIFILTFIPVPVTLP